ncbi:putative FAD binding domain-containing protein [Seiridium unicorne]|uniref:FAD binding domain-containing protein n=1 Tax=Seiridium unicorne TaxID=138068 RepID=A0ABR2UZQ9_9PEZI
MGSLSSLSSHDINYVDLVIVGGGPTGLLSAVLARQQGLTVSIIDEKPGRLELGRADALNARTQQYLQVVGILKGLRSKGIECNTSSTFADGVFKSRQSHWWTSLEHCLHKNFLMIGQPDVEAALLDLIDTPVNYKEQVVAIVEDEKTVTVRTSLGRTVKAKYAIAADGARSMVRSGLGISFTGTKPEMVWAVLDTFIDTDFPVCSEIITFQLNGQARVSWIPRERGMARFYVLLDGEINQARAENSIREHMAPHRISFVKTEWFSTFEGKFERIASSFVSKEGNGRIILAGDAAHVHSVNGGQGLNTGVADAFGLGWRIAAAVHQERLVPDVTTQLIRSYDIERRTVAQDVINVAARLVRDTMHSAQQYVATIEKNAGYITGMGVSYDGTGSPLIIASEHDIWSAGRRCPDLDLFTLASEKPQRLYSIVKYGDFLILQIGSAICRRHLFRDEATYITILGRSSDGASATSIGVEGSEALEFSSEIINQGEAFVAVVRPDMYIGYVGDEAGADKYMSGIFALPQ